MGRAAVECADRSRLLIGTRRAPSPLGEIQPEGWQAEYTTELLNVLHVLTRLVAQEPAQAALLKRICEGPLLGAEALRGGGAFDEPSSSSSGGSRASAPGQLALL